MVSDEVLLLPCDSSPLLGKLGVSALDELLPEAEPEPLPADEPLLPESPPEPPVEPAQFGTDIVSTSVETVPPNAKALPVQVTLLPMVIQKRLYQFPQR